MGNSYDSGRAGRGGEGGQKRGGARKLWAKILPSVPKATSTANPDTEGRTKVGNGQGQGRGEGPAKPPTTKVVGYG